MPAGPVKSARGAFAIPSLDGVRAVAVMVVFVGHGLTIGGPWPGDVGVTVFFFLSGFLITTLLRREHSNTGRISLGKFYLRRALRILPPAYITITLTTLLGVFAVLPSSVNGWGVLSQVLNYSNYYMVWAFGATGSAHTGLPPESSMLWSLAVEEHFYLVFPAVLIVLLWRKLSYRTIGYVLLTACAAAPVWRIYLSLSGADFYRLYVSTDTRFDGLLAGAAMALLANPALGDRPPFRMSERAILFTSPFAITVFALTSLAPTTLGLTVGDSVIYACLVPLFWVIITRPDGLPGRILNNRFVAHIGVLSFSIYLLHRTVIALVHQFTEIAPLVDVVSLLLSVAAAQGMYLFVEKPLGRVRKSLESRGREVTRPVGSTVG